MTRILVVCAANVCRSRLAASALADGLASSIITVRSAGTRIFPGTQVCEKAKHIAVESFHADGERLSQARPTEISMGGLRAARLILVADRSQRALLARLNPESRSVMFTLLEAERLSGVARLSGPLVGTTERTRFLEFVDRMDSLRGRVPISAKRRVRDPLALNREAFDIEDGHNRSPWRHRRALKAVARSSRVISQNLMLAVGGELDERA